MNQRISCPLRPNSVNEQNTQLIFSSARARVAFLKFGVVAHGKLHALAG